MAKTSTVKSGGPARVRLVVFDAEVPDGDFNSLAQVLQNALKTPTVIQAPRAANGSAAAKTITHQPSETVQDDEPGLFDHLEAEDAAEAASAPAKPKAARKAPKAPDIVPIEMNEPVSFADFAAGKKNDSLHKKYLIAAAWLHECRNTPIVTDGHIYTCFRSIGWSTAHNDFGQPFRELKARKFFTTPARGQYEINHIGLDYVKKLANGAE